MGTPHLWGSNHGRAVRLRQSVGGSGERQSSAIGLRTLIGLSGDGRRMAGTRLRRLTGHTSSELHPCWAQENSGKHRLSQKVQFFFGLRFMGAFGLRIAGNGTDCRTTQNAPLCPSVCRRMKQPIIYLSPASSPETYSAEFSRLSAGNALRLRSRSFRTISRQDSFRLMESYTNIN